MTSLNLIHCWTTVANRRFARTGQAILEALLILPFVLGFMVMLLRVSAAINISIVNQKYVRTQTLKVAFHSPHYPEKFRIEDTLTRAKMNRMAIGMSHKAPDNSTFKPDAPVQTLTKKSVSKAVCSEDEGVEPDKRCRVRVRTMASLCTPMVVDVTSGRAFGTSDINENTRLVYCNEQ